MSYTIGIDSHLFQFAEAEFPKRIGNGNTDSGMILVVTNTFYLDVLSIQPKTSIVIETDCTETTFGFDFVCYGAVLFHRSLYLIEGRTVGRPKLRV